MIFIKKNKVFLIINIIILFINLAVLALVVYYCSIISQNTAADNQGTSSAESRPLDPTDIGEYPFPVDDYGYPKGNIMVINGEEYTIAGSYNNDPNYIPEPTVIEIKKAEKIKIAVADHGFYPYDWCIEDSKDITAVSFTANCDKNIIEEPLEGGSDGGLRVFEVIAKDGAEKIVLNHITLSDDEEDFRAINETVIIKLLS